MAKEWDIDGQPASGLAAENLPPNWFTKDAERDPLEKIGEMEAVLIEACQQPGKFFPPRCSIFGGRSTAA